MLSSAYIRGKYKQMRLKDSNKRKHIQSQQLKHKKVLSPNLTANQQNHSSAILFFKDNLPWGKG